MAFKASNSTPAWAYERLKNTASDLKRYCSNQAAVINNAGYTATQLVAMVDRISTYRDTLASLQSTPRLVEYVVAQEEQVEGVDYDVVGEYNAMAALITDLLNYLVTTIPQDENGFLLLRTIESGTVTDRTFTPAALATLVGHLNAVAAQVE